MKIIKDSNQEICQLTIEQKENQDVLKLDFNIIEYKALLPMQGWTSIKYPKEFLSSIKDKLYINKKVLYEVIKVLDIFLETGDIVSEKTTYTNRGFAKIDLEDMFSNPICIQKSSTMGEDLIWFGTKININDIGYKKEGNFIRYQYEKNNGISVIDRLELNQEQAFKLRHAMLNELSPFFTSHDIADLVDKKTKIANDMIIDMWGNLTPQIQRINFMYACGQGNLDLIKKIYKNPENKFLDELYCSFEEFGLQMSMQPESKHILKFFKLMMKEKDMQLSHTMEKWVRDNRLGRKIRLKN